MQLTQFTDYALRALIYIGVRQQSCTINEISQSYAISRNHLIKIIQQLAKMGIIKTTRGKNGGIQMAIAPHEINLKHLILQLEPNFDLVPCFNQNKEPCRIASACKLQTILYEAQKAFLTVLEKFTLAEIMHNQAALQQLLNINQ